MAMAFGSSASRSAAAAAFSSYDLGTPLGHRLVTVRGKRFVELEGLVFDAERFGFRRTSSPLYSPRSGPPDTAASQRSGLPEYSPATPEYTPLTPSCQRCRSPDYSPATPEYMPLTPSSQRCGSPDYSPATPEYTPLTPSSQRCGCGSPDYSPATTNYTPRTPSSYCLSDYLHAFERYCISPSTGYSSRAASPEYTPIPEYTPRSPSIPEYTPLAPLSPRSLQRASSPDYTPSSPSVPDAVSRTSPPSHRRHHHPYQRSRTSRCQNRRSSSQHGY